MERARYLSVVPQARNMPPAFSVYESVLLGRTPYLGWMGRAGESDHERVRYALERTQMLPLADRIVGELSGGEQQRVLLARALAQDTPVMLLDEPTTHLDLQHRESLVNLVRELAVGKHLAVLMVLHDLNLASLYADRISLLVEGRIQATGTPGGGADRSEPVARIQRAGARHPAPGVRQPADPAGRAREGIEKRE